MEQKDAIIKKYKKKIEKLSEELATELLNTDCTCDFLMQKNHTINILTICKLRPKIRGLFTNAKDQGKKFNIKDLLFRC